MSCSRDRRRSQSWRVSEYRGRLQSSRTPERRRVSPKYRGPFNDSERRTRSTRYSDYRDSYYRRSQSPGRRRHDSNRDYRSPSRTHYRRNESRGDYLSSRKASDDYWEYGRRERLAPRRHPDSWHETTSHRRRDYSASRRSMARSSSRNYRYHSRYHKTRTPSISRDRSISSNGKYHTRSRHGVESRGSARSTPFSRRSRSGSRGACISGEAQNADPHDARCRDSRSQDRHNAIATCEGSLGDNPSPGKTEQPTEEGALECHGKSRQSPECPTPNLAPAGTLEAGDGTDTRPRETSTHVESENIHERKGGVSESKEQSETQGTNCDIDSTCMARNRSRSRSAVSLGTKRSQRCSETGESASVGDRNHGVLPINDGDDQVDDVVAKHHENSQSRDFDDPGSTFKADADEQDVRKSVSRTPNASVERHGSRNGHSSQRKQSPGHFGVNRSQSRGRLASEKRHTHSPLVGSHKAFREDSVSREMVGETSRVSEHWGRRGQGATRRSVHVHDHHVYRQRIQPIYRRWEGDQFECPQYNSRVHAQTWSPRDQRLQAQEFAPEIHPHQERRYIRVMGSRQYGREVRYITDHNIKNPYASPWARGSDSQLSTPGVQSGGGSLNVSRHLEQAHFLPRSLPRKSCVCEVCFGGRLRECRLQARSSCLTAEFVASKDQVCMLVRISYATGVAL